MLLVLFVLLVVFICFIESVKPTQLSTPPYLDTFLKRLFREGVGGQGGLFREEPAQNSATKPPFVSLKANEKKCCFEKSNLSS